MTMTLNKNIARGLNTLGYWVGTFFTVQGDAAYPTGGYSFAANLIKLGAIEYMAPILMTLADGTIGILAQYNYTTNKLQMFWVSGAGGAAGSLLITGGQAAGIALQTDVDSNSGVLGKTTAGNITIATTIGGGAAGSGLKEVDSLADISLYTGRGVAFGKG